MNQKYLIHSFKKINKTIIHTKYYLLYSSFMVINNNIISSFTAVATYTTGTITITTR